MSEAGREGEAIPADPADLTWRLEQRDAKRQISEVAETKPLMNSSRVSKMFLGIAIILTLMPLLFAGITKDEDAVSPVVDGLLPWIGLISVATIMVLSGLFISGWRWPFAGGVLVVVGAILMGLSMLWFAPAWLALLIVAVIGIMRARKFGQARRLSS